MLDTAGLRLGTECNVPSDEVAEDKIVDQDPAVGIKVDRGTSVRVTVAQRRIEEVAVVESTKGRFFPRPDSLPD
jgi:beta-lactam-binding protein with PASTA domain